MELHSCTTNAISVNFQRIYIHEIVSPQVFGWNVTLAMMGDGAAPISGCTYSRSIGAAMVPRLCSAIGAA